MPTRTWSVRMALTAAASVLLFAACTDRQSGSTPTASPTGTVSGTPAATPGAGASRASYGIAPGGVAIPVATAHAVGGNGPQQAAAANIGHAIPKEVLDAWDTDITPDGNGLPAGRGQVAAGAQLFASNCQQCHGQDGTGTPLGPRLVLGDQGKPGVWVPGAPRTVANYWPYLTTYVDYIRRAMPFDKPNSLTDEQVYALVAWLLNRNGMLPDDAALDANAVKQMNELPNFKNFIPCYPAACGEEPVQTGGGG